MMNVSFGKKIPIFNCQILNNKTKAFEPATIYEYDCSDKSDVETIKSLDEKDWLFKIVIGKEMEEKYKIKRFDPNADEDTFFVMENKQGQILGMAQLQKQENRSYDIKYIESSQKNKLKYVGQLLIASMAEDVLRKNGRQLTVTNPFSEIVDFYSDTCGFDYDTKDFLKMDRKKLILYLKQTEDRTYSKLIDLRA